jgi:hypothetical protein
MKPDIVQGDLLAQDGAGSGSFNQRSAKQIMLDEFNRIESDATVIIVEFIKK